MRSPHQSAWRSTRHLMRSERKALGKERQAMSLLDFKGRVALVTGSGRGMGRSHARLLASRGARVVVNDLPSGSGAESAAAEVVRAILAEGGTANANPERVLGGGASKVVAAIRAFGPTRGGG